MFIVVLVLLVIELVVVVIISPSATSSATAAAFVTVTPVVLTRRSSSSSPSTIFAAVCTSRNDRQSFNDMDDDDDDDVYADVDLSNFDVDAVIAAHQQQEAASSSRVRSASNAAAAASTTTTAPVMPSSAPAEVETTTLSSSSPSKRRKVSVSPPPHIGSTSNAAAAHTTTSNRNKSDSSSNDDILATSLKKTLYDTFGYTDFRPGQLQVLQHLMQDKRDVAVYWATGQGKSLCYQIPALYQNKNNQINNMVVVVSPLISLMQDQCHKLNGLAIGGSNNDDDEPIAAFLGSAQLDASVERNALQGKYKILYVTPEKMTQDAFLDQLARLHSSTSSSSRNNKICLIAVDEAHCVRYAKKC
jgi:superfamily II DNA helicase RecQ